MHLIGLKLVMFMRLPQLIHLILKQSNRIGSRKKKYIYNIIPITIIILLPILVSLLYQIRFNNYWRFFFKCNTAGFTSSIYVSKSNFRIFLLCFFWPIIHFHWFHHDCESHNPKFSCALSSLF